MLGGKSPVLLRCTGSRWALGRLQPRQRRQLHANNGFFKISDEVREALQTKKPVVALETTIYTHGFPYPDNVALASHLESVVRMNGGVPATIGVLEGIARVGMSADELIALTASAGKPSTIKVSRRDLGYICGLGLGGRKLNGGTTIAGTMVLAHLAGIKVFATGGLGGVHRGGENSLDISADLTELGRTPVAVVSSGCKSFLDIPRTLEYLETQGVSVGTFADGRNGKVDFPGFWSRESGVRSPATIVDEEEAAAIIHAQSSMSLNSGLLFGNPIPSEHSIPKAEMDIIIAQAIHEAESQGASGSDNTPFILSKIKELSGNKSVVSNRALIESNVARGTKVAVQLAKLELREAGLGGREPFNISTHIPQSEPAVGRKELGVNTFDTTPVPSTTTFPEGAEKRHPIDIIVAGSMAVDLSCDFTSESSISGDTPTLHTSNTSVISQNLGGVGCNIARASHSLGVSTRLCGLIGDDLAGGVALDAMRRLGLDTAGIQTSPKETKQRTAQYIAFNDLKKNLVMAMADMQILEESNESFASQWQPSIRGAQPKWMAIDANWSPKTLIEWIVAGKAAGSKTAFEPVSAAKSTRLFAPSLPGRTPIGTFPSHHIDLATPNHIELAAMFGAARENQFLDRQDWWQVIDSLGIPNGGARDRLVALTTSDLVNEGIPQRSIQLLPFIPCLLIKLGSQGILMTRVLAAGDPRLTSPESAPYILSRTSEQNNPAGGIYMRLFPPAQIVRDDEIVSVNGIGDTFLGVLLAGLVQRSPLPLEDLIQVAQEGSVMTLRSKDSVHPHLGKLAGRLSSIDKGRKLSIEP
ncbi:MAG: hypothetical protein M4579_000904 [Chaenotheca gracillima]|nr:MAG: hypothetical protein M4579_000904 [Chaenotheca gracillima]